MRERPLRVLESFHRPKSTTNPYIIQLYESLNARPDLEVQPFTNARALFGRYDVFHAHWPELLMGGHNWRGRAARRLLTAMTIMRWRLSGTKVVRTVHNVERPTNINAIDHALLDQIDKLTQLDIHLNDTTPRRPMVPRVVIPHGHYRDWYTSPRSATVPGRIAYVGLIRRYKGVDDLVKAFTGWRHDDATLHIAGKPSSTDLVQSLERAVAADRRVTIEPKFLDDPEFVRVITSSQLVVLPYRHMHNSGTALAALSLDTPVLVPDNEVNRALASESGAGWVQLYEGALTSDALARAWTATQDLKGRPDMSSRDWDTSANLHALAFSQVMRGSSMLAAPGSVTEGVASPPSNR